MYKGRWFHRNSLCLSCSWNCFNYKFNIITEIVQVCACAGQRNMPFFIKERETKAFGLPSISVDYLFTKVAAIIVSNGGYFRFPLKI